MCGFKGRNEEAAVRVVAIAEALFGIIAVRAFVDLVRRLARGFVALHLRNNDLVLGIVHNASQTDLIAPFRPPLVLQREAQLIHRSTNNVQLKMIVIDARTHDFGAMLGRLCKILHVATDLAQEELLADAFFWTIQNFELEAVFLRIFRIIVAYRRAMITVITRVGQPDAARLAEAGFLPAFEVVPSERHRRSVIDRHEMLFVAHSGYLHSAIAYNHNPVRNSHEQVNKGESASTKGPIGVGMSLEASELRDPGPIQPTYR